MKFADIKPFVTSTYMVNIGLDYFAEHIYHFVNDYGLDLSPDFQRGYVWTEQQKIRYMEYFLRGGQSGRDIYINCPTWHSGLYGPEHPEGWMLLVDGKQRIEATLGFLNNEFPVFGNNYRRDFTDHPRYTQSNFNWHVNQLATREECLQWYLDLNSGGTVHSEDELNKVRKFMENKVPYVRPSMDEMLAEIRVERPIFQHVMSERERTKAEREATLDRMQAEAAASKKNRKRK